MSWVAVGAAAGAVIGGALQADAAGDAADAQAGAANNATAEQRRQFDLLRQDQAPYRQIGVNALDKLTALLDSGSLTSRFAGIGTNEPGYDFGLREGQRALTNSAAARGMGLSGEALKAAARYGNDYATTKYNDAFNRWNVENNSIYNRLAGISGLGQTATAQTGQAGMRMADQIGENMMGAANARAAAGIAQGNIYGNMINQLGAIGSRWNSSSGGQASPQWYNYQQDYGTYGYPDDYMGR